MPLFINYKVKMFNGNSGKKHRLDTNVFILFKKEEEHLYFIIQIEAFSWLGFVAGFFFFFFSSASGKLFYLDLLSEQGRELCNNKCSIAWLYFAAEMGSVVSLKCQE